MVIKGLFSAIKFETGHCFDQNSLRNKLRLRSSLNPSLVINLMQRRNPLMYQQVPLKSLSPGERGYHVSLPCAIVRLKVDPFDLLPSRVGIIMNFEINCESSFSRQVSAARLTNAEAES